MADEKGAYPPAGTQYPPAGSAPYPPGPTQAPYPSGPAYPPAGGVGGGAPPPYQAQPGALPPQAGPPPAQQINTTVVVVEKQAPAFRPTDVPGRVRCPNCNNDVMTNIFYTNGTLVWVVVLVLLFVGLWAGCCLIPLCITGLKDVEHTCPVCNYHLGKYERMKF